jgi:hypothetical protein
MLSEKGSFDCGYSLRCSRKEQSSLRMTVVSSHLSSRASAAEDLHLHRAQVHTNHVEGAGSD